MSRKDFFKSLPSNAVVAEIGVDSGGSSEIIRELNCPKELYLIDPWDLSEWSNEIWDTKKAKKEVYDKFGHLDNVKIIENFSIEASKMFEDQYFDWVYIEASLQYEDVKADLVHWLPKIKKGGYLCGGQFSFLDQQKWPAVNGAVIEFILEYIEKRPEVIETLQSNFEHSKKQLLNIKKFNHKLYAWWRASKEYRDFRCALWAQKIKVCEHPPFHYHPLFPVPHPGKHFLRHFIRMLLPENNYWYDGITPPEIYQIYFKWAEHFPNGRTAGGNYKIKIGDWVDDLNFEEMKAMAVFEKIRPRISSKLLNDFEMTPIEEAHRANKGD